jgi:hypothetical protein
MKADPDQQRVQSRVMSIGRAVLAAILALSFLAFLVPLGKASADGSGLKACCIGKAGHESGSCSTGLIESGGQTGVPQAPPPKTRSGRFANVKGVGSGEHCSHTTANDHSDVAESPNTTEKSELTSASKASGSSSIRSVSSTCSGECGTCSVSYTRRPRQREQSTQSSFIGPNLPLLSLVFISDNQQARSLNCKWSQLQPRAPPAILA